MTVVPVSRSDVACAVIVSAISTNLPALREHWRITDERRERPLGARGGDGKPPVDLGGALCRTADFGRPRAFSMPSAMVADGGSLLVASTWAVSQVAPDLAVLDPMVWDLPLLNAVHWLTPSSGGWLVVSSGIDLVMEVDGRGAVQWTWWAFDHGYERDPLGRTRHVDRDAEHRGIDYGTLANVTHVNSAAELDDGSILATLFHQGQLVRISRSGRTRILVSDLDHPHAVRRLPDGRASVVDTGRGRVLLVDVTTGRQETVPLPIETDWLQDAWWDDERGTWVLVDGRSPRVLTVPAGAPADVEPGAVVTHTFDPGWRLYGAVADHWTGR